MSTAAAQVSRWSKRFTVVSVAFALLWGVGTIADISRNSQIVVGLFGFVFHMIFGKGYALVPTYFDRDLEPPWLPMVQFPLSVGGTVALAAASITEGATGPLTNAGALLWFGGVVVFVGGLALSVRGNLTGTETGTGEHNSHRRGVDRLANLFMPIALAYLVAGSYEVLAAATGLPLLLDGYRPRSTHLLAVGTATLFVFAIGVRLFPRLLRATPPKALVAVVLPLGAVAPAGLAATLPSGEWFVVFALAQAGAVVGYAVAIAILFYRADSPRIGAYGVLCGAFAGVVGVGLGVWFAVSGIDSTHVAAHLRVNLLGFLGLTIVGATYQFYPPAVSQYPGGTDRTAAASIAGMATGLSIETVARIVGHEPILLVGELVTLLGIVLYAAVLYGVLASR
ncbi:hypothetical protein [Halovenus marina]|uniref:hypothetical protein n=1 Tax=Halovenus marina TaxID=3396621 RepID=UPI003F547ADB